ncbi:MAG: hypothetical protein Q8Q60_02555 [Candidatus Chromulinivorax sp.]|nr:hypothetical protein [Candidatus Chromulinivorax sp.]
MKTIIQIFVVTLCLAILGQSYLQAFGNRAIIVERHEIWGI